MLNLKIPVMRMKLHFVFIGLLATLTARSQSADTTKAMLPADSTKVTVGAIDERKFKTRFPKDFIAGAALIGYGLTTIKDNGIYSSFDARRDVQKFLGGANSKIDNLLVFAPYLEFAGLLAFKVKCRNDLVNTSLLILKSELIMAAVIFGGKFVLKQERPYSYYDTEKTDEERAKEKAEGANAFQSLPSGHTSQAFVAAAIVNKEFRYKSPWPGIAAYSLASSVALYRMINDKHWQSDVLVGAGIGILSVNLAYATHRFKWGNKSICAVPTFGKQSGIMLVANF
jgi:membrane-associated phospholipid phosphatase